MIRLGIMSVAHLHAEGYVHNIRAAQDVELIGIADEHVDRRLKFAAQFGVRMFERYEELLDQRLDGVVICAENSRHRKVVEMAAAAGVHVLCEKPLATTVPDAKAMVDACRRAEVELMTAFPMRFSAPLLEVKRVLENGTLGRIYCCAGTNQGKNPRHHREWFVKRALAGGGAVSDHTVHLADVMRWLFGSEVVEVYAQANEIMPSGGDVESAGLVSLQFENGIFATIDCSWSRPAAYPTWGGLSIELLGERGAISADAFRQTFAFYPQDSPQMQWHYWGSDSNQAMIEEFLSVIREHRTPRVTGLDGYRAVEVVAAAYESIRRGQPVRIEPSPRADKQ